MGKEKNIIEELSLYPICKKCEALCCTKTGPAGVFPQELPLLLHYLKKRGLKNHLKKIRGTCLYFIPRKGKCCPYLDKKDYKCKIQKVKPIVCAAFPFGFNTKLVGGFSNECPALVLLSKNFKNLSERLLQTVPIKQKLDMAIFSAKNKYSFSSQMNFGFELILDLYGCNKNILKSKKAVYRYNKLIVPLIEMKPVGSPIIKKIGKNRLFGFSSIQFIQTSSILIHISEEMLEAHINIFSCKSFDTKKAVTFTKKFWDAEKILTRVIRR